VQAITLAKLQVKPLVFQLADAETHTLTFIRANHKAILPVITGFFGFIFQP